MFGASGSVGSHVISVALQRGYEVIAVTRNRDHIRARHPKLQVVQTELDDLPRLESALSRTDAVLVSLGGAAVTDGTQAIVTAMHQTDVRRIEVLTGFGTSSQSRKALALPM